MRNEAARALQPPTDSPDAGRPPHRRCDVLRVTRSELSFEIQVATSDRRRRKALAVPLRMRALASRRTALIAGVIGTCVSVVLLPACVPLVGAQELGIPVQPVPTTVESSVRSFPKIERGGERRGSTKWLTISGTGNCCENYLLSTAEGRIIDIGGSYLKFSDDGGRSWHAVGPTEPLVNAEGSGGVAPNGDVVAMTWDALAGDRVVTYKYNASDDAWYHSEQLLHQPLFDRPWLAIVKGPFDTPGGTAPYVSLLMSNLHPDFFYYSFDGLNYTYVANRALEETKNSEISRWVAPGIDVMADYAQPHTESGITPLNAGGALAVHMTIANLGRPMMVLEPPSWSWHRYAWPQHRPNAFSVMDSRGVLHSVDFGFFDRAFTYRRSVDGGRTQAKLHVKLPSDFEITMLDLKASGAAGIAAVALRASSPGTQESQDFIFKIASRKRPRLIAIHELGTGMPGDAEEQPIYGNGQARIDFASVAILQSGRLVVSFLDRTLNDPAIAIELGR